MPQSSPVVNELIKLWVQIAHLPSLDPRIQDAYSALILYLQQQYGITIPCNGREYQSQ